MPSISKKNLNFDTSIQQLENIQRSGRSKKKKFHVVDDQPVAQYIDTNPKYQRMMLNEYEPIPISGPKEVPPGRKVLWKNVCMLGLEQRECILEFSRTKTKFFIVALDLEINKYHVIELFRPQANKIIKGCDNSLNKLMTFLEFKYGTLCIKDQELLLNY